MNTIHRKWLEPMPAYYADWSWRDSPMLADDYELPGPVSKRVCEFCGEMFTPKTSSASHRIACYSEECGRARRRRNNRNHRARLKGGAK